MARSDRTALGQVLFGVVFVGLLVVASIPSEASQRASVWSARATGEAPRGLGAGFRMVDEAGLLIGGALFLFATLASRGRYRVSRALIIGGAALLAFGICEALKVVVQEVRPCRVILDVATIAQCPVASDWSWPSGTSTFAAALAAGTILMRPTGKIVVLSALCAAVVGVSRVLVGMHYVHDVAAGFLLGVGVVSIAAGVVLQILRQDARLD